MAPEPRRPARTAPGRWLLGLGGAFLLLAAISVGYLVFISAPASRSEAFDNWESRLAAMANDRQMAIERWVSDLRSDAQTLAQYPTPRYLLSGDSGPPYPFDSRVGPRAHIRELFTGFVEVHGYERAVLYDTAARAVSGSGEVTATENEPLTSMIRGAMDAGTARVGFATTDPPVVSVAAPIRSARGDMLGAVVVGAHADRFLYPLLTQQPVPSQSGETLLVGATDGAVLFLSPLRKVDVAPGSLRLPAGDSVAANAALAGAVGIGRYVDYRGDRVLAATQDIDGTPWALVAKVDIAEVLADHRGAYGRVVAAILGLLVGALGVAFGAWRWQRQRLESAVVREQARFAALLDHANDPIFFLDTEGRILELNRRAAEFYGYERGELIGRHSDVLRSPEDREEGVDHRATALERGTVVVSTEHVRADGERTPVEISTRAAGIEGQTLLISIVRDVRERVAAEEALRKTEERYRTLVENLPDLIARFDAELRCRFVSLGDERQSPFEPDDPIGLSYRQLGLTAELTDQLGQALQRVFETGESEELEVSLPGEGQDRAFDWRLVPERDRAGSVTSAVMIVRETTERRALEQQLRQSQKMEAVGRLAGGVAHDFNNILTSIQGHASLAREELDDDQPLAADLDEIVRAAERAASLTRQLLAFSRRQIFKPRTVDVGEIVTGMENMIRRLIGEDIELEVRLDGDGTHTILADPSQIEQVVLNLAVNARDAMPRGGRLRIRVDETETGAEVDDIASDRAVRLTVSDTGMGMDPDTVDHIFEPFFTTKAAEKGTGLGLSTVYGIIEQSGGAIDVESEPGQGTVIELWFPAVDPEEEDAPAETADSDSVRHRADVTILLVEDEAGVRGLARRVLEREGYQVVEAGSGMEALERVRDLDRVHLLLTDMVMPGMDGRELADRVRDEFPGCRVLLMSGYTEDEAVREQRLDGETGFIEKPFTPDQLSRNVAHSLAGHGEDG